MPPAIAELEAKLRGDEPAASKQVEKKDTPPAPTLTLCLTCNKPIDGDALSTTNADGIEGVRHKACGPATNVATFKP